MPDILIRGMKMPDSCEFCRFSGYGGYEFERVVCSLTGRSKEKPIFSRFDDCPLAELPPHGDLVDATQYRDEFMNGVYDLCADDSDNNRANAIIDLYDYAPVIVPASEEATNG